MPRGLAIEVMAPTINTLARLSNAAPRARIEILTREKLKRMQGVPFMPWSGNRDYRKSVLVRNLLTRMQTMRRVPSPSRPFVRPMRATSRLASPPLMDVTYNTTPADTPLDRAPDSIPSSMPIFRYTFPLRRMGVRFVPPAPVLKAFTTVYSAPHALVPCGGGEG
ncbi:hypothetical protein HK101_006010 [Irineochytrium annulatum]|nr:hypothetical protein HK101_006010 [Irineochytrium annulatum]